VRLRERLSDLRALLLLSILMTDGGEDQILRLVDASAPTFGGWWIEGFVLDGVFRPAGAGGPQSVGAEVGEELIAQVLALGTAGGSVKIAGRDWSWALPLPSGSGRTLGHIVVAAPAPPSSDGEFLLQVLAQQTGVALSNARLHERDRLAAEELQAANAKLSETVATLRQHTRIHDRLARVAATGGGRSGIADALHELTGRAVAIEDRYGNLRAWAGPGRPDHYPKEPVARRAELLGRLERELRPLHDRGRLVALAVARPGVAGLIVLADPGGDAGRTDVMALEHGVTVLAAELARLRGLVDAELRLRGELVNDLLNGMDDDAAAVRAEVLGHDLGRPHRVVLVQGAGESGSGDFLHAVRRAADEIQLHALIGARSNSVVIVAGGDADWAGLRAATIRELGGGHCRIGVGEACERPSGLPRSYREAELALRMQAAAAVSDQVSSYAELGVFRMLAALPEQRDVERFVRHWLGALIDYDARRGTELVATLSEYLEQGGNHAITSRRLSVHRNTLKYRMQRIRELSGHDPSQPDVRFNLQLAARAWATLQALRHEPTDPT
jgi:DNA-binding PucR family transcriptional regulator